MSRKSFGDLGRAQRYVRLNEVRRGYENVNDIPEVQEQQLRNEMQMIEPPEVHDEHHEDQEEQAINDRGVEVAEEQEEQAINDQGVEVAEEQEEQAVDEQDMEAAEDQEDEAVEHPDENEDEETTDDEEEDEYFSTDEDEEEVSEEEEDGGRNQEDIERNQPLYFGAPLSVTQSMLLLLTLVVHHNLNMSCLADIITVINLHCLAQGLKKNSLFKFQKFFLLGNATLVKHYYCTTCHRELQSVDDACPFCPRRKNSYFIQMSATEQLKEMFNRDGFYESLQGRFQRPMNPADGIRDIYDGSVYRRWMNNGFLTNPRNFSLSWYTDGVPVFKSSQISMWPIYLSINELPFKDRKKKENTLLLGLWFGKKKPAANLFLQKLRPELERIAQGVQVSLPRENIDIIVRGVLLTGIADLPAKSEFMNFMQFNGKYGCPTCCIEGETIHLLPRGFVRVYPYTNNVRPRSSQECVDWADQATPDHPVMGVKGPTAFSTLMPDFIEGTGVDRMHGVEGGVIKKLLTLMFDTKYSAEPFSLYGVIDVINHRLLSIKPPKFVHRMPRSITELVHWKASELKMWCYIYSIPVLEGVMRQDYFEHYLLLITGVTLLNSENITPFMIDVAQDFLHKFVRDFEVLYGLRFCSINIHQILHLPDCVRRLGPLWTFTCFEYENINGQLLKLVHGTGHIDTQIAKAHHRCITTIRLIDQLPPGSIRDFCLGKKKQVSINQRIHEHTFSVGAYQYLEQLPNNIVILLRNARIPENTSVRRYFRLLRNGKLYVSTMYRRDINTRSNVVQYFDCNVQLQLGSISFFIKTTNCHCMRLCECGGNHYAVIQRIETDDVFFARGDTHEFNSGAFLNKCHAVDDILLIPVDNIVTVCVFMDIDNQMYIGIPVNQQELE